jgi:drug/metabolite transporter (DMT)-like permease
MSKSNATLIGFTAVLMWAFLALLSSAAGSIPPFQLSSMTFAIGAAVGFSRILLKPSLLSVFKQPLKVWLVGTIGLCLYHCAYFFAIQSAPPVEASLIAYLWPLLIVVFAAFLPGESLRMHHVIGVVLGLVGAVLIITKGGTIGLQNGFKIGHAVALACAFIWSAYSVLSRQLGYVPTDIVSGFCLITAIVSLGLHMLLEPTTIPQSMIQWGAVILLGLFPVGGAFYTWDFGVKRGDIMVLGAASYASPLLSTIILLLSGYAKFQWIIIVACLLITFGAVIAAKDLFRASREPISENA